VRVALGATPRALLGSIVGRGMLLAGLGVAAGSAAALVLTRSMQGVLYGVGPSDPLTFVQVALVMLAAALLARSCATRAYAFQPGQYSRRLFPDAMPVVGYM
jgi:hypothetical protein